MSACAPVGKAVPRCDSRRAEAATSLRFDRWRRLKAWLRLLELPRRSEMATQERPAFRRTASMTDLSKTSSTNQDRHARPRWLASAAEALSYFDKTATKSAPRRLSSLVPLSCYIPEPVDRVAARDNPCSYIF